VFEVAASGLFLDKAFTKRKISRCGFEHLCHRQANSILQFLISTYGCAHVLESRFLGRRLEKQDGREI
jgi:hypothetical protein